MLDAGLDILTSEHWAWGILRVCLDVRALGLGHIARVFRRQRHWLGCIRREGLDVGGTGRGMSDKELDMRGTGLGMLDEEFHMKGTGLGMLDEGLDVMIGRQEH